MSARPEPELEGFEVVPETSPARDLIWPVRAALVGVALLLTAVLTVGACLRPYEADGTPRKQETHRQLGLPPCSFYRMTGLPCPSCGFTTSFSLVMHLDLINAVRANWVGTMLAVFCVGVIPWAVVSAWRGRYVWIASAEQAMIVCLVGFVAVMLARWVIIVGLTWLSRS